MGVDPPPAAPQRMLRIKKKKKPTFVPPASASAAPADSDAPTPAPPVTKKHAWQHVAQVREDLRESFRPRSTEEELGSVRFYRPADPTAGPATQRGPTTQRGPNLKFTPTARSEATVAIRPASSAIGL